MANCTGTSTAALLFLILAGGLCVLSLSTDHWADYKILGLKHYKGLVKHCTEIVGAPTCTQWVKDDKAPDYIRGCLAAMVLGLMATAAAGVIWILWMMGCCNNGRILWILKVLAMILLTAGCALVLLAVIVFAIKDEDETINTEYKLYWSWGLAILTAVCQIITLLLMCGAEARGKLA